MSNSNSTFWKSWGHVIVNAIFALLCSYGVLYIRHEIETSLKSYVSLERYDRDWTDHKVWGDKQLTRIDAQISEIRTYQDASRARLDTLIADVRVIGSELIALRSSTEKNFDKLDKRLGNAAAAKTNSIAAFE